MPAAPATDIDPQYVTTAKTEATRPGQKAMSLQIETCALPVQYSSERKQLCQLSKAPGPANMGRPGTAVALSQHKQKTHIVSRWRSETFRSRGGKPLNHRGVPLRAGTLWRDSLRKATEIGPTRYSRGLSPGFPSFCRPRHDTAALLTRIPPE